jgi:ElaB/YqjD/DUF883 family membrane-anchored ribosome-binding protein
MTDVTGGPTPQDPTRSLQTGGEARSFDAMERDARIRRAADAAADATSRAMDQSESLLASGIETAQAKAHQAREWANSQRDMARETVVAHPFASVAAVFGAGLICGLLMARR